MKIYLFIHLVDAVLQINMSYNCIITSTNSISVFKNARFLTSHLPYTFFSKYFEVTVLCTGLSKGVSSLVVSHKICRLYSILCIVWVQFFEMSITWLYWPLYLCSLDESTIPSLKNEKFFLSFTVFSRLIIYMPRSFFCNNHENAFCPGERQRAHKHMCFFSYGRKVVFKKKRCFCE